MLHTLYRETPTLPTLMGVQCLCHLSTAAKVMDSRLLHRESDEMQQTDTKATAEMRCTITPHCQHTATTVVSTHTRTARTHRQLSIK